VYLEKVICQKLLQFSSREEYKLQFCTLLLPVTFLLANFLHFSQQFRNQRNFETLKPYSQETAQNFEKRVLQKCLRIAFYTFIHHNHCTLVFICRQGVGDGARPAQDTEIAAKSL
jgi:hypothetical protein